jgi:uncharacterized membrane protein YcaP (DUF421 family)
MTLSGNWNEIFVVHLPLLEKILRPVIVYIAMVILLRVFGKRELAQLNPFDLVVLLSLANTVQNAIIGNDNSLTGGLIGALSLLSVNYFVVRFVFGHRRLDQLLEGSPAVLIRDGEIQRQELASELMTEAELLTVIRRQGFTHLREVKNCQLEPGGAFAIEGKTPREQEAANQAILEALRALQAEVKALRKESSRS